jgi:peptide/nickel transport system substrate-binding protein
MDDKSRLSTRFSRRSFLKLGVGVVGAAAAAAGSPRPVFSGASRRGGTLNVAVQNDWVSFDPVFNNATPNGTNMLYGEWFKWDKDPKTGQWGPVPEMIAEWDLKPNEVTFKLRRGIKFHDGTPWNAKAAKWNLDRMAFDPASAVRAYLSPLDTATENKDDLEKAKATAGETWNYSSKCIEVVNEYTLKLRMKGPWAPLLSSLSNAQQNSAPICPTAYLKHGKAAYGRNPVGAGPFRFVEWKSGDHVTFERNPDYWKKSADGQALPYLDKIIFRAIPDDSVRLLELRSGNIHFTEQIAPKDVASVRSDSNLSFIDSQSSGMAYRLPMDMYNVNNPFKKSLKLRQALQYSIDREAILKVVGFNQGYAGRYLLPKGALGYDEGVPAYQYDKAKAQQILKDAVTEMPSLVGPDGKVNIEFLVIDRVVDKMQAEMIKQMADAIGFNLKLNLMERTAFVTRTGTNPGQGPSPYELCMVGNPTMPADPDDQWRSFVHSQGWSNTRHIFDPNIDKLIDGAAGNYNAEARKNVYKELAQTAYGQALEIYLWNKNWNWAFSKKLNGFREPVSNRWMFTEVWFS